MKNIMKEAHRMTKEIKAQYPEVDYQAQLGICLSFLYNEEETEMGTVLEGTEKQIKFAEDIKKNFEEGYEKAVAYISKKPKKVDMTSVEEVMHFIRTEKSATNIIEFYKKSEHFTDSNFKVYGSRTLFTGLALGKNIYAEGCVWSQMAYEIFHK